MPFSEGAATLTVSEIVVEIVVVLSLQDSDNNTDLYHIKKHFIFRQMWLYTPQDQILTMEVVLRASWLLGRPSLRK